MAVLSRMWRCLRFSGCVPVFLAADAARAAQQAASGAIPFKSEAGADASLLGSGVGVLVVSLIAIAVVLFLRRRLNLAAPQSGKASLVKVLETQRMGPRALLFVVEFGGAHHLVAHSEHGVTCLAQSRPAAPGQEPQP